MLYFRVHTLVVSMPGGGQRCMKVASKMYRLYIAQAKKTVTLMPYLANLMLKLLLKVLQKENCRFVP